LLINNGGYSVETVTGKEQQIIMNGELFKDQPPIIGPYEIPCVSLTFEDEDFDVSIIVVATEGEDRYSNTLKDLPALQRKHTVVERFAFKESLRTSIIAMLHHTKLKEEVL
jgi:hypothetical protein